MELSDIKYIIGAYATAPSLANDDKFLEREFYDKLIESIPEIRGLEVPFWGKKVHKFGSDFLLNIIDPNWQNVLSCIPGTMNALSKNSKFGLASDDKQGRVEAVSMHKLANQMLHKMNDRYGGRSVISVQIATAPSVPVAGAASSKGSLLRSMDEILSWDWGGAKVVIEHCDTAVKEQSFEKGFLPLEDEVEVLSEVSRDYNVGATINWARSAIEGRSVGKPIEHAIMLSRNSLLSGLMFSGVSECDKKYGAWKDTHMPFAQPFNEVENFEKESLLTEKNIVGVLDAIDCSELDYLGIKLLSMPIDSQSIEKRVGVNKDAIFILNEKIIMTDKKILVTLGPESLKRSIIQQMNERNVYLYRINLSHTKIRDLREVIDTIMSSTDTPICLDSEGAQIRNQNMENEAVEFHAGEKVKIHSKSIIGDATNISFTPDYVFERLEVGDKINVDFNSVKLELINIGEEVCEAIVAEGGFVGSNKASDLQRDIKLNPITEKDEKAFEIGKEYNISNYSLSFTNSAQDVLKLRNIVGDKVNIISKIESINGLKNINSILDYANEILIDRGDLSRQVPIEKIPFLQRRIIEIANNKSVPVNVATNLLESMIHKNGPTRAEVNDVVSSLLMGADGLVLAAETAIGKYPVEAVSMIRRLIQQTGKWSESSSIDEVLSWS